MVSRKVKIGRSAAYNPSELNNIKLSKSNVFLNRDYICIHFNTRAEASVSYLRTDRYVETFPEAALL